MARISIITSGHFSTSPRVWKEADALAQVGHKVTVLGVSYDRRQAAMDEEMLKSRGWRWLAAADLRGLTLSSRVQRIGARARNRVARWALTAGRPSAAVFGYAVEALRRAALGQKAELTILHLEPALWIGQSLRDAGQRFAVDMEDWYSENRPAEAARETRFLRGLEKEVLAAAAYVTTTSQALASALAGAYELKRPEVVMNSVPRRSVVEKGADGGPARLLWFSQTIGPARGLEDLCGALAHLRGDWNVEIRGQASDAGAAWIDRLIPAAARRRVRIEPLVSPDQLHEVVSGQEIGLALDFPWCRNKDLTVSNKILHYLQAGLTVAAARTSGTEEIRTRMPEAVKLYEPGQAAGLANLLNGLIRDRAALNSARTAIAAKANDEFAYEQQARKLVSCVERALQAASTESEAAHAR